jgi:hypothetical protein
LRQAVDQGFSIPQSWSLLAQTMAAPVPGTPGVASAKKAL